MWTVRHIEFRKVELDFASSGQGRAVSTAADADGLQLANALTLLDSQRGPVQMLLCGHCGIAGCKPRDWVSLRRLGDGLVLIPSFEQLEGGRADEYQPPAFINEKGAAFISGTELQALGTHSAAFREPGRWPHLTVSEFACVLQWEAPGRLLGDFPNRPRLRRDLVVAADPGEREEMMTVLDDLLARAFTSDEPVRLGQGCPITFYLDLPGFVEWVPMAFDRGSVLLANGADWIVSFPREE